MSTQQHNTIMTCPLCGYRTDREYHILLHMEEYHPEGRAPVAAGSHANAHTHRGRDTPTGEDEEDVGLSADEAEIVDCPIEGCFEQISLVELDDHIYLHEVEKNEESTADAVGDVEDPAPTAFVAKGERDYRSPYSRHNEGAARSSRESARERSRHRSTNEASTVSAWKKIFSRRLDRKGADSEGRVADGKKLRERLGVGELGKYAYEKQMPDSLVAMLRKQKYEIAEGIIPILATLLEENPPTETAWLCDPAVQHITKLRGEGGFCGYRNIQMLSSYIVGARAEGTEKLRNKIPSIFRIQDYIESAWDEGINANGRVETGGIRGTRKYIGTPEAQAMFVHLGIPCEVEGFKSLKDGEAEELLFAHVLRYFEMGVVADSHDNVKVHCTDLPPIYFQYRGHSLTIVGLERRVSGSLKLLVFDPFFHDPDGVLRLVGKDRSKSRYGLHRSPDSTLRLYQRGEKFLGKYRHFEILRLRAMGT
ncbi:peptidase family C78-domain-containing protein [Astrocystis sublimbata]|nr:peptidase family C78-domain-containing protein [Astrocystis sublimbata]